MTKLVHDVESVLQRPVVNLTSSFNEAENAPNSNWDGVCLKIYRDMFAETASGGSVLEYTPGLYNAVVRALKSEGATSFALVDETSRVERAILRMFGADAEREATRKAHASVALQASEAQLRSFLALTRKESLHVQRRNSGEASAAATDSPSGGSSGGTDAESHSSPPGSASSRNEDRSGSYD
mmetsp:Transcript_32237/g.69637  ORF Transcript_32237/g.69637 Transcript_32237/m.69637 type:complete len:183 (-) Transcript_32237:149-697(-)